MTHFVRVAEVYFFNSYNDYIHNENCDQHFIVYDEAIDNMDVIIYETIHRRMTLNKLNYFKIVEGYKFLVEDENDEQI